MHTHASDYHAVLVQGTWIHTVEGDSSAPKELTPGSYVFQPAWQFHNEKFSGFWTAAEPRMFVDVDVGESACATAS